MRIIFILFFIFLRILIYLSSLIYNVGAENGLNNSIQSNQYRLK